MAEEGEKTTTVVEENMEVEAEEIVQNPSGSDGVENNGKGDTKRSREDEDEDNAPDNGGDGKKQKVEKSVEEERLEELQEEKEGDEEGGEGGEEKKSELVSLGPKNFSSSVEMFDYFYKFLHYWPTNVDVNKYEQLVLLDLIKKGHVEPDNKIGGGIRAFQVRYHPMWKSRCFFIVRVDDSVDDFSFRKCVDHILPLPEELKIKPDANKVLGGREGGGGGGRGRGGRGGGRGGRGGGGRKGGWGGRGRGSRN